MVRKKIESKKKIDAGGTPSKTAKRSQARKKEEGFQASGDMDRIIPLCGGEWAYLLDPRDGRTYHVRVGSDKWNSLIGDIAADPDPQYSMKIQKQLNKLGWD
jgi:hypothetical protein